MRRGTATEMANRKMKILNDTIIEEVRYELFVNDGGNHAIRVSDVESGETVGVNIYRSPERAAAEYDAMVAKALALV